MASFLPKQFRYGLLCIVLLWAMIIGMVLEVCHGLISGTILNGIPFAWLFHQPEYVNYLNQPRTYWGTIGVAVLAALVLGAFTAFATAAHARERRSFQRWSSRPPLDKSIRS